jgi:hypothetical protein
MNPNIHTPVLGGQRLLGGEEICISGAPRIKKMNFPFKTKKGERLKIPRASRPKAAFIGM